MHASTAGVGLPKGIFHTAPTTPVAPDDLQLVPVPSTVMYHTGNAISLAHRLADGRKNPATLIFLPQPMGSPCRAATECEMDLLQRTTYHDYRAAVNSMHPMDLLFIPDGCLLFRDSRLYGLPPPSMSTRLSLAVSRIPLPASPDPPFAYAFLHSLHTFVTAAEYHGHNNLIVAIPSCGIHCHPLNRLSRLLQPTFRLLHERPRHYR